MNRPERESTSVPLTEVSFRQVSWPRGQDYQARPCLDLRLGDVESSSLVFFAPTTAAAPRGYKKGIPLPAQGEVFALVLVRTAAKDVRGQKALGPFHELIFHSFALVKSPVTIFLNSGKVDKDVFPG